MLSNSKANCGWIPAYVSNDQNKYETAQQPTGQHGVAMWKMQWLPCILVLQAQVMTCFFSWNITALKLRSHVWPMSYLQPKRTLYSMHCPSSTFSQCRTHHRSESREGPAPSAGLFRSSLAFWPASCCLCRSCLAPQILRQHSKIQLWYAGWPVAYSTMNRRSVGTADLQHDLCKCRNQLGSHVKLTKIGIPWQECHW